MIMTLIRRAIIISTIPAAFVIITILFAAFYYSKDHTEIDVKTPTQHVKQVPINFRFSHLEFHMNQAGEQIRE
jgi:hypothetical protein